MGVEERKREEVKSHYDAEQFDTRYLSKTNAPMLTEPDDDFTFDTKSLSNAQT